MKLIVLFIALIVLLALIIHLQKKILLTPQFAFVISFCLQLFYAIFYINKWNLDLSDGTFFSILGGVSLFVFTSILFGNVFSRDRFYKRSRLTFFESKKKTLKSNIRVGDWKLIFFLCFQIFTLLLVVRFLFSLSSGQGLAQAMYYYRYTNLFTEDSIVIPSWIRSFRTFCTASGYIWTYLFIHNIYFKNKNSNFLLLSNVIFSCLNEIILGARTGIFTLLVAALVQYYFIRGIKLGWKKAISFKVMLRVVIIVVLFLGTFQVAAKVIGRNGAAAYSFFDYIAGYLSAEIKNLDLFIRAGQFGADMSSNQTLNGLIPLLAKIFNRPEWIHKLDLPFVYINGYNYGNVYTIFYSFIHDAGYVGILIYIPIMAIISQISYNKAVMSDVYSDIPISLITYSYIFFMILFSFFSNKFYETIINTKFIWTLISWYLVRFFINKINIKL